MTRIVSLIDARCQDRAGQRYREDRSVGGSRADGIPSRRTSLGRAHIPTSADGMPERWRLQRPRHRGLAISLPRQRAAGRAAGTQRRSFASRLAAKRTLLASCRLAGGTNYPLEGLTRNNLGQKEKER